MPLLLFQKNNAQFLFIQFLQASVLSAIVLFASIIHISFLCQISCPLLSWKVPICLGEFQATQEVSENGIFQILQTFISRKYTQENSILLTSIKTYLQNLNAYTLLHLQPQVNLWWPLSVVLTRFFSEVFYE